jgi:hypothetical protein
VHLKSFSAALKTSLYDTGWLLAVVGRCWQVLAGFSRLNVIFALFVYISMVVIVLVSLRIGKWICSMYGIKMAGCRAVKHV